MSKRDWQLSRQNICQRISVMKTGCHFNSFFVLKTPKTVFVFVTEILWQFFWCDNCRSVFWRCKKLLLLLCGHLFHFELTCYVDFPLKIEWPKCLAIFLLALTTFCNAFSLHKLFFSAPWAFSKTSFSANKCSDKWYLNKVWNKKSLWK